MKSEERHQLAQNDLQVGLNRWLDKIEPYSNQILVGVVVATIVAVGLIFWTRSTTANSDAGWAEMSTARTTDQFLQIAEDNAGKPAGTWATLQAARMAYSNGIETALTDRKASDDSLKQAKDLYSKLLQDNSLPELREEALKGMALTLEATSGGDLKDAINAYETLVKEFPESSFKAYAEHRIEELKEPSAGEFYAWFRKQNPKPADRPLPSDGQSGLENPLKTPDLPMIDLNEKPAEAPAAEKPAAGDAKSPELPALPMSGEKTPPAATPPATEAPTATPMPMPEAPAAAAPMPMAEAPATPAPMPEPMTPAPMPETPAPPATTDSPK